MKCIIFQKFTFNYLFFLSFLVVSIIRKKVQEPLFEFKQSKSKYFYLLYVVILSHFLAIIPFLINKYLTKKRKEKQENEGPKNNIKNKINYIYNDDNNIKKGFLK